MPTTKSPLLNCLKQAYRLFRQLRAGKTAEAVTSEPRITVGDPSSNYPVSPKTGLPQIPVTPHLRG